MRYKQYCKTKQHIGMKGGTRYLTDFDQIGHGENTIDFTNPLSLQFSLENSTLAFAVPEYLG
jgi:hypothetical protein